MQCSAEEDEGQEDVKVVGEAKGKVAPLPPIGAKVFINNDKGETAAVGKVEIVNTGTKNMLWNMSKVSGDTSRGRRHDWMNIL